MRPPEVAEAHGFAAGLSVTLLSVCFSALSWAVTPVRFFLRMLLARSRRAPMSIADEVNALCASVTKAVEGPQGAITRTTNAELLAELSWTVLRTALGKPPQVRSAIARERGLPASYLQPFHGQPHGYLSPATAALTERYLEIQLGAERLLDIRKEAAEALGPTGNLDIVLDLGSGSGTMLRILRIAHKRARLFGVELSPYMIAAAYAHQLHSLDDHVEVVEGNITQLSFDDGNVRGITACWVLHELSEQDLHSALKQAVRVLAIGGRLVIVDAVAPKTTRERIQFRVTNRLFHDPYLARFVRVDLCAYLEQLGLLPIDVKEVGPGVGMYVFEKPPVTMPN